MYRSSTAVLCLFVTVSMLLSAGAGDGSAAAGAWEEGFEKDITGHTFDEKMWTNDDIEVDGADGGKASFTASYVNHEDFQAFMVAFNGAEKDNQTGMIPYQLFGMHYYTPGGNEVFLGAVLASLIVFNDTNGNGYPDPDDGNESKLLYVFPFGVGNEIDPDHTPKATAIPVRELGEGHYSFGMKYENLYAIVTPNPLLSALLRTGWIAEFSELTVTYEITVDEEAGTVTAETFYTIGQVTDLWTFILGVPIHSPDTKLDANLGLGALHYVSIFTSKYQAKTENGKTISPGMDVQKTGKVDIGVGEKDERAFQIGFRGDFDLIDEGDNGSVISEDNTAYNVLLEAKLQALLLVGWQLKFSAGIFSAFAWGLSEQVRESYQDPEDLANNSLRPLNPKGFGVQALWYAVTFPSWQGYRVEHDPVYTAYTTFDATGKDEEDDEGSTPGFEAAALMAGFAAVTFLAVLRRRTCR